MVDAAHDAPTRRSRWALAVPLALCAVSLAGTAVGVIPTLNALALGALGRDGSAAAAHPSTAATCALLVFQTLLFFAANVTRSRFALRPVATCTWAAAFATLLVAVWIPIRAKNIVYLRRDMSVVTRDRDAARDVVLTGSHGLQVWDQRSVPDEGQDFAVVYALNEAGGSQFLELQAKDLDGCMDAVRRKHPPLAYLAMSLVPFDPVALRAFCLCLFVVGLALIVTWCYRELGNDSAQAALLLFASAAGVIQELALRMNLDVFVFTLGGVLAFAATPLLRGGLSGERSGNSQMKEWIATCAILSVMVMIKFTVLVTAFALSVALFPRWKWRALCVVLTPACVFGLYHLAIALWGVPFSSTYLGELLASQAGDQARSFQGGGLKKSLVTLVAFILSPLGAACWIGGLGYACWPALTRFSTWKSEIRAPLSLMAVGNVAVVYVIHPLLRYVSPGMWAVAGAATAAFTTPTRIRPWANSLLSAAAAYGLTKLVIDAYW